MKPELLSDALKCARLYNEKYNWVIDEGVILNRRSSDTSYAEFRPSCTNAHSTECYQYAWLINAVFEHPRRKSGEYHINIVGKFYEMYADDGIGGTSYASEEELIDFCIRALVVLEGL